MKQLLIIAILVISLLLAGCSSVVEPAKTGEEDEKANGDEVDTVEASAPKAHEIGETITFGIWEITLNLFTTSSEIEADYLCFKPDEGNIYLVGNITIKNIGTDAGTFLPSFSLSQDVRARIIYDGTYEFTPINLLGHNDDLHDETINPLSSKTGIIVFSVAEEAAESEKSLVLILEQGDESIEYVLR